jgi:hypothetical protein
VASDQDGLAVSAPAAAVVCPDRRASGLPGSARCAPGRAAGALAAPAAEEAPLRPLRAWETDERLLNVQRRFQ